MKTYPLKKPDNLAEMLDNSVKQFASNPFLGMKDSNGDFTRWITYEEFGHQVGYLRSAMKQIGIGQKEAVGIISNNSIEWALLCYATYGLGAHFVPMYEKELTKIWKYIIKDSLCKLLFVANQAVYDKVKDFLEEINTLKKIIIIDSEGENSLQDLLEKGRKQPIESQYPDPATIANIIYTSGTTGDPKGVMLTHGNFTSNIHGLTSVLKMINEHERSLAFLPWAHSMGLTCELHHLMFRGASAAIVQDPSTLADDIKKVCPSLLLAVPRVYNAVYSAIMNRMETQGGMKKKLFDKALKNAQKKNELEEKGQSSSLVHALHHFYDNLVFKKVREGFGGQLKFGFCGSAALSIPINDFFHNIGIPIYTAYGLTETSPVTTMEYPGGTKKGSSGKPIEMVEIKIDTSMNDDSSEDGEILVYGPNIMKGYHNKPEQTKEVLMEDGGLRTGDRGKLDQDGFLYITGRIKEQFKLENGKYVFPNAIEEEIKLHKLVENVMIFGFNKPYTVAIIVPDFAVLQQEYKEKLNLPDAREEIVQSKALQEIYLEEIKQFLTGKFGNYEIPKKILLIAESFTVENGYLTPTQKLKRRIVLSKYQNHVESLY